MKLFQQLDAAQQVARRLVHYWRVASYEDAVTTFFLYSILLFIAAGSIAIFLFIVKVNGTAAICAVISGIALLAMLLFGKKALATYRLVRYRP